MSCPERSAWVCELRECEIIRTQIRAQVSGLLHRARCTLERLQLYKCAPAQALRGCTATAVSGGACASLLRAPACFGTDWH